MTELKIKSLDIIKEVATEFITKMGNNKIFAFYGEMGAGKTTFIKQLCKNLGVNDEITSPTFSLVNEYQTNNDLIYHFDFYRIEKPEEALDFGIYEYLDSGKICFLEWPEMIEELLPEETIKVYITLGKNNERTIQF
jgi:tRNA threonylcarbamoyladenosine biosynthesis protein TsaE